MGEIVIKRTELYFLATEQLYYNVIKAYREKLIP